MYEFLNVLPPDKALDTLLERLDIDLGYETISTIEIRTPVAPYQHVRHIGEDIVAQELLLPTNHQLRPQDLSACASAGLINVEVRRHLSVSIIPTGTEWVAVGHEVKPRDIIDSNSIMLASMIENWGGLANKFNPVPDDYQKTKEIIVEAVKSSDIVLVNAGSSAGSRGYTTKATEELGELIVHGLR